MKFKEIELYPFISQWLHKYLENKYKKARVITTYKSYNTYLSKIIERLNLNKFFPSYQVFLLKVDIVGFLIYENKADIVIVEVKKGKIDLKDIAQCLGYAKIINPIEVFIISPEGITTNISKLISKYGKKTFLVYDCDKKRYIKICKWNLKINSIKRGECLSY